MGEDRKTFKIKDGNLGEVKIADEVVAIIAGLAATEVEGVGSMAGNITNELVSKLGMKNLSKGIRVEVLEGTVNVDVALNISYGYSIPEVSAKVQDRVKNAIENMTGLEVSVVNIRIASKLGMKNLSKGIRVEVLEGTVNVDVALNISYGYSIPEVSAKVQDRVKNAIENMTGLEVSVVNIRIASVDMGNNK